jgi:hypothetical protein
MILFSRGAFTGSVACCLPAAVPCRPNDVEGTSDSGSETAHCSSRQHYYPDQRKVRSSQANSGKGNRNCGCRLEVQGSR